MDDEKMLETAGEESGGFMAGFEETEPAGGGEAPDENLPEAPGVEDRAAESAPSEPGRGEDGGGEAAPAAGEDGGEAGPQDANVPPDGGEASGADSPGAAQSPPPPKQWTLNHMGQAVTFGEADVPALAEKALDYDRVSAAYEEARPVMDLFRGFAKQANLPVTEYVARLRIQAKQMEGMDETAARRAVDMEDREARVFAQEEADRARQEQVRQFQESQRRRQERVQADIREFMNVFPDAARKFRKIPQEVWDAVNGGMSLVAAYARYNQTQSNAQAQAAEEAQRRQEAVRQQTQKNAAASTGSMKSAGSNHGPKDAFLEGWDE